MSEDPKPKIPMQESFEIKSEIIHEKLKELAGLIDHILPDSFGFSLFLYELHPEQEQSNIFYISSLHTADSAPLIRIWLNRQTQ